MPSENTASTAATVSVTSTLKREYQPDQLTVGIDLTGQAARRDYCMAAYTAAYRQMLEVLSAADVTAQDVQTDDFRVFMRRESLYAPYEGGGGYYYAKDVPDGYGFEARLSVKTEATAQALDRLWGALSAAPEGLSFDLEYGLSNKEALLEELMAQAVADAVGKARALAAGAGKQVTDVVGISYGAEQGAFFGARTYRMDKCMAAGSAPDLNPAAIAVECQVTVQCAMA